MTRPLRVALIVDNPYRDLPGLVLLAWRLCQDGILCHLVPYNLQKEEIWPLAPDFVLLNFLRRSNEDFARSLTDAGVPFGVLDTEGGVFTSLDFYAVTMAEDSRVRSNAAIFCSWGPVLAEHAQRAEWYTAQQIAITGTPRYDFYAYPWRSAALNSTPGDGRLSEGIVLFNGNFPFANPAFQSPEQELDMYISHFDWEREDARRAQALQQATLDEFAALAVRTADHFPETQFVYRPHPFEGLGFYRQRFDTTPNLHLVKEGAVTTWILRSQAVIQRGCSTAIEAALSGVPALSPAWIPTREHVAVTEKVSIQCASEIEMYDALASISRGSFSLPGEIRRTVEAVEHDWFFRVDGRSHDRVARCIVPHVSSAGRERRHRECRRRTYELGTPGGSIRSRLRRSGAMGLYLPAWWSFRRFGSHRPAPARWDGSDKRFHDAQVRALADAVQTSAELAGVRQSRRVAVSSTQGRGDYHFGYVEGRSITISPE